MDSAIPEEYRSRILELIAEAQNLISTVDSWCISGSHSANTSHSSASSSSSTGSSRTRATKSIDGLVKFRRRIQAELDFLQVRFPPFRNLYTMYSDLSSDTLLF